MSAACSWDDKEERIYIYNNNSFTVEGKVWISILNPNLEISHTQILCNLSISCLLYIHALTNTTIISIGLNCIRLSATCIWHLFQGEKKTYIWHLVTKWSGEFWFRMHLAWHFCLLTKKPWFSKCVIPSLRMNNLNQEVIPLVRKYIATCHILSHSSPHCFPLVSVPDVCPFFLYKFKIYSIETSLCIQNFDFVTSLPSIGNGPIHFTRTRGFHLRLPWVKMQLLRRCRRGTLALTNRV